MASGFEIERKWLVADAPPEVMAVEGQAIDQGYLTIGAGGAETRLRRRAGEYILTVKAGAGMVRSEASVLLDRVQFDALWPLTEAARVEKVRRVLAAGEVALELDVYRGSLEGLIVAEVEFPDAGAAMCFAAPSWFGPEVTDDARYKNQSLALHGRP